MTITTEQQTKILQLTQAMFGAAPRATYLRDLESIVSGNPSVADLAQSLSGNIVFLSQSLSGNAGFLGKSYSGSLDSGQFANAFINDLVGDHASTADKAWTTNYIVDRLATGVTRAAIISEITQDLASVSPENARLGPALAFYNTSLATKIVDNLAGSSVTAAAKTAAADYIVSHMAAGQSFGQMVEWAITTLGSIDHSEPDWGSAATLFDNRIEVSKYYSVDKAGPATDLATLQQVLAGVTTAAGSIAAAKSVFDTPQSGTAQDGYLSGATVFSDDNGNGVQDGVEASVITDAAGNFTLPAGAFGKIIATGGIDILTNLPFTGTMTAPAGSTVVSPLTTVMQSMVESGATVEQAQSQLLSALGLPATVNLQTLDSIAVALGNGSAQDKTDAAQVQAAMSKVANILELGAAAIQGASIQASSGTTSATDAMANMVSGLANFFSGATGTVDLTKGETLQSVMGLAAADTPSLDTAAALFSSLDGITSLMSSANTRVDTAMTDNPTDFTAALSQIAKVQVVVQGSMSDSMQSGMEAGSLTSTVSGFTGTAFDAAVAEAEAGDLTAFLAATGGTPPPPTPEPEPDTGPGPTNPTVTENLDGLLGTFAAPATFDAASGEGLFNFTDMVGTPSFTRITHFGADDSIAITGGGSNHLIVANNGADVVLTVNDNGTVSQITLVGVTSAADIIGSLSAFNALGVGDVTYS